MFAMVHHHELLKTSLHFEIQKKNERRFWRIALNRPCRIIFPVSYVNKYIEPALTFRFFLFRLKENAANHRGRTCIRNSRRSPDAPRFFCFLLKNTYRSRLSRTNENHRSRSGVLRYDGEFC